jgi:hypothetical protein
MKSELAEQLLAKVMEWEAGDLARERPLIQDFASLKYDEYHNFSPGMRFVESLAMWLNQFATKPERDVAYRFLREKLVFFSDEEVSHFVGMAFPDFVRPHLMVKLARELCRTEGDLASGPEATEFRALLRKTLFLGMSDGAHIDSFRRFNPTISHEQVYPTPDLGQRKGAEMLEILEKDLSSTSPSGKDAWQPRFRVLVLLDDFSASGFTCTSKLKRVVADLVDPQKSISKLFNVKDLEIVVVQYIATQSAITKITTEMREVLRTCGIQGGCTIEAIQMLPDSFSVAPTITPELLELLKNHFDPSIVTSHYLKGRHERPFLGFDECALPVILAHNTPNDSLPILWFDETHTSRGLFPRVPRHGARP